MRPFIRDTYTLVKRILLFGFVFGFGFGGGFRFSSVCDGVIRRVSSPRMAVKRWVIVKRMVSLSTCSLIRVVIFLPEVL